MNKKSIKTLFENAIQDLRKGLKKEAKQALEIACKALHTIPETERDYEILLQVYNQLAYCEICFSRFDEANLLSQKALIVVSDHKNIDIRYSCDAWFINGMCEYYLSNYQNALVSLNRSINIALSLNDHSRLGKSYTTLGNSYFNLADYDLAAVFYQKSLEEHTLACNQSGVATALNNIGILFRTMNKLGDALEVHQKSLAIRKTLEDHEGIAMSYNNIANIYYDLGEFEKALIIAKESHHLHTFIENLYGKSLSLNILSKCYRKLGKFESALIASWEGLQARLSIKDRFGELSSYLEIGDLYSQSPNLPKRFL